MIGHKNSRDKRKMSALSTHFDRYHSKDDKLPVCTIGAAKKQINSPKAYALGELLVRVTGVEPARTVVRESESDVTLVKTTTVPLQRASCCYPEFKRRAST